MAKKAAIIGADQLVTHSHLHRHAGGESPVYGETNSDPARYVDSHGHWHAHDARDKERHEHLHDRKGVIDVFPHDGCAVEKLPPELPKVAGEKPRRKKQPVA